jgi:Raf kinase inhibitor-like YbhB/YbcL family protein
MANDLTISSEAFLDGGTIPVEYTCDSNNVNPPLNIGSIPNNARSLVLIVDDPDASQGVWDHWIVWNIKPAERIEENSIPGIEGISDFGEHHFGGPCPPSGIHRYFFKVCALNAELKLPEKSSRKQLTGAMKGHILAQGELVGLYGRRQDRV